MKPFSSPTSNTRINTRMPHDHRTIHTSGHTVLYDHHTTSTVSYDCHTIKTVQVRIIHGQVRPETVSTSVQSSCMVIQSWSTTDNTTCCHIERNPIMPPGKKKAPKRIATTENTAPKRIATTENTKRASKALQPLQPADSIDPDELGDPLVPPDETSRDSDSDGSSMGPTGTAAPTKVRKFMKPSHQNESIYIKPYTNV